MKNYNREITKRLIDKIKAEIWFEEETKKSRTEFVEWFCGKENNDNAINQKC